MRDRVDIAIVGGGLAGSALAAVLARRGVAFALCDLHGAYPPATFRAEKLTARADASALTRLGLVGDALRGTTAPIDELAIARFGRIVERAAQQRGRHRLCRSRQCAVRTAVPAERAAHRARRPHRRVAGPAIRAVTMGDGRRLEAKLVVVATGLGAQSRRAARRPPHRPRGRSIAWRSASISRSPAPSARQPRADLPRRAPGRPLRPTSPCSRWATGCAPISSSTAATARIGRTAFRARPAETLDGDDAGPRPDPRPLRDRRPAGAAADRAARHRGRRPETASC